MDEATLDAMIGLGVYEVSGVDDSGETLYSLNVAVAKEKAPDIYWEDRNACETAIFDAVESGFLEWDINPETMEMEFWITEEGSKYID